MSDEMSIDEYNELLKKKKTNKYHAQKTVIDGQTFASKAEAGRYKGLKLLERNGDILDLKTQVKLPCWVNDVHVCDYIADFTYIDKCGGDEPIIEDVKGSHKGAAYQTFRLKKKLILAIYGIDIRET